jgi:hypothetical protein
MSPLHFRITSAFPTIRVRIADWPHRTALGSSHFPSLTWKQTEVNGNKHSVAHLLVKLCFQVLQLGSPFADDRILMVTLLAVDADLVVSLKHKEHYTFSSLSVHLTHPIASQAQEATARIVDVNVKCFDAFRAELHVHKT